MILRTYLVLVLHNTHVKQPTTMTSTSNTTNPLSRDPRTRGLKRVSHKGQEKCAGLKDALRRKSIPRLSKIQKKYPFTTNHGEYASGQSGKQEADLRTLA